MRNLKQLAQQARACPDDPEAWFDLTHALIDDGLLSAALEALDRGRAVARTTAHWLECGRLYERLGDPSTAAEAYREGTLPERRGTAASGPLSADAHHQLGRVLLELEDVGAALLSLKVAVKLHPGDAHLQQLLTKAKLQAGVHAPDNVAPIERSRSLAKDGRRAEARRILKEYAEAEVHSSDVLSDLGRAFADIGEQREAVQVFRAAVRQQPTLVKARLALAEALIGADQMEAAIAEYRAVITLDDHAVDAHRGLGLAYAARGDREASIRSLIQAAALAPDDEELRSMLAWAMQQGPRRSLPLRPTEPRRDSVSAAMVATGRDSLGADLSIFSLGDILDLAVRNCLTGRIRLLSDSEGAGEIALYQGHVAWAHVPGDPSLYTRLYASGLVLGRQSQSPLAGDDAGLAQWVVEQELCPREQVRSEVEQAIREAVARMAQWKSGRAQLFVHAHGLEKGDLRLCIHPHRLLRPVGGADPEQEP